MGRLPSIFIVPLPRGTAHGHESPPQPGGTTATFSYIALGMFGLTTWLLVRSSSSLPLSSLTRVSAAMTDLPAEDQVLTSLT